MDELGKGRSRREHGDRLDNDYILKSDDRSIGRIWHHHQDAALARLAGGDF
jgi:hypothetical protein